MPELPEVETVVRGLHQTVINKTIAKVTLRAPASTIVVSKSFGNRSMASVLKNKFAIPISKPVFIPIKIVYAKVFKYYVLDLFFQNIN